MAEVISRPPTKTAVVRGILEEIGALKENPPKGWRQQVEEALKKQGVEMHSVTIYQIRSKAMKDGNRPKASRGRPKGSTNRVARPVVRQKSNSDAISVNDLLEIQKFAEKFGGLDNLNEAINTIKSFQA